MKNGFKRYRRRKDRSEQFYDWLEKDKGIELNKEELENVKKMFSINATKYKELLNDIEIVNKEKNVEKIESILSDYEIEYVEEIK